MAQPKKTGLGKGLDALFGGVSINEQPQETVVEEKSEINDNLKSLKITEVEPNRDQPRKQFKQETVLEILVCGHILNQNLCHQHGYILIEDLEQRHVLQEDFL